MSDPIITQLPHSQVEINFVVTPEEAQPFIDQAVIDISNSQPIRGFRPGKAGYNDVKLAYGEMSIWESALERIVRAHYVKTVMEQKIDTIGSPEIKVKKLVPHQEISFSTTATLMPQVSNLVDYAQPLVTRQACRVVTDEEVQRALDNLRKVRRTEAAVDRAATMEDAVLIDLEIKKDQVIVEGGATRDYKIYLFESHYIPGFSQQLVATKKGVVKTFELKFPPEHYNKQLAGQSLEFTAAIKDVIEIKLPAADDTFAQEHGLESSDKLRQLLRQNLQTDADQKANEAAEIALLDKLVKNSRFTEIPELLINEEVRRMYYELEHSAEERGMQMADYLSSLKKTADQIKLDLVPRAIERIQTAVLIKEIGKRENVEVTGQEIEAEQNRILDSLPKDNKETRERVASPDYRDYIAAQMKNRKVLELLKAKGIRQE